MRLIPHVRETGYPRRSKPLRRPQRRRRRLRSKLQPNPQRESANPAPAFSSKGGDHVSVQLQTQGRRAGKGGVQPAPALQPGARRTRRNQEWVLHMLLSLFDLHQARLSLDAAHREFLRRALPWTRVRRSLAAVKQAGRTTHQKYEPVQSRNNGHPCGLRSFDGSIKSLRRLLSILLLVAFGLPVVSPLLAMERMDQTRLPACCRRDGKHHCMASMSDRNSLSKTTRAFSTPTEKCPYCPSAIIAGHTDLLALPTAKAVFASLVSHTSGIAQTESLRRISRDRSRQKRGPPTLLQS
jgi:hypothetical protein